MVRSIILFFFVMLTLTGCHTARRDGPPNFYVDETKIPNAVPKHEPLARLGNKPYRVFGQRYCILRSSRNYSAIGIASWYGSKFHKHRTSSGEPYNMLAMTAAHRSLPLPTYVEVKNLANHRKVVVKVNDRGPFRSNRLIDLSYVAAKKLGMLKHGTAWVSIRAIDPCELNQPFMRQPFVYLQVGAFRDRTNAEKFRTHLENLMRLPIRIATPSFRQRLYRVQIGPIHDLSTADKITARLRILGFKSNKTVGV